jgi:hypothetical protein
VPVHARDEERAIQEAAPNPRTRIQGIIKMEPKDRKTRYLIGNFQQCHKAGSKYIADLDAGQMVAKAAYSRPRDELAVVEFDSLEVVAVHQVVQAHVSDQRAVVQLYTCAHVSFLSYAANAQLPINLCGNCVPYQCSGFGSYFLGRPLRHVN